MARLARVRSSWRASGRTSGLPVAVTCWHSECDSGVWRLVAHGSASPTSPGNTCRSSSTTDTSATGTRSMLATSRAKRSIPASADADNPIRRSAASRAAENTPSAPALTASGLSPPPAT